MTGAEAATAMAPAAAAAPCSALPRHSPLTRHMLVSAPTWELSGRLLLGLPADTSRLYY